MKKQHIPLLVKMFIIVCFCLILSACSSITQHAGEQPYSAEATTKVASVKTEPVENNLAQNQISKTKQAPVIKEKQRPLICIEAGHQRKANSELEPIAPGSKTKKEKVSSGTEGITTKKPEYELTLEVALKLEKALKPNYDVLMIRRSNDVNISNSKRAQICNEAHADVMIRLHADGNNNHNMHGMALFYPAPNNEYTQKISQPSLLVAQMLEKQLQSETNAKSNGIKQRSDLTGFNWIKVPSVLIEMGFMSNHKEDILMSDPHYQDKIVAGIKKGLDEYYLN